MWVIVALSLLILLFGAYTAVRAQLDYNNLSDKLDEIAGRTRAFEQLFPTAEVDGVMKPDLTNATQDQLLLLATIKREERQTYNERVDYDNERRNGVRIVGVGIMGLALAYLVAPERKREPAPGEAASVPPSSDEPPFDLSS